MRIAGVVEATLARSTAPPVATLRHFLRPMPSRAGRVGHHWIAWRRRSARDPGRRRAPRPVADPDRGPAVPAAPRGERCSPCSWSRHGRVPRALTRRRLGVGPSCGLVFSSSCCTRLGHFVTAKWSGMKATEFFVGFGPRLWSVRRGETEYGVKALPLGGYVKILGMTSLEELDPSDEPRSFVNQSTVKRVLVASAGSIVHLLLALLLAIGALWFIGQPTSTRIQNHAPETSRRARPPRAGWPAPRGRHRVDRRPCDHGDAESEATLDADLHSSRGMPCRARGGPRRHDVPCRATPAGRSTRDQGPSPTSASGSGRPTSRAADPLGGSPAHRLIWHV